MGDIIISIVGALAAMWLFYTVGEIASSLSKLAKGVEELHDCLSTLNDEVSSLTSEIQDLRFTKESD